MKTMIEKKDCLSSGNQQAGWKDAGCWMQDVRRDRQRRQK